MTALFKGRKEDVTERAVIHGLHLSRGHLLGKKKKYKGLRRGSVTGNGTLGRVRKTRDTYGKKKGNREQGIIGSRQKTALVISKNLQAGSPGLEEAVR